MYTSIDMDNTRNSSVYNNVYVNRRAEITHGRVAREESKHQQHNRIIIIIIIIIMMTIIRRT